MAYRDDLTALSARHDALAGEVAQKSRELEESRRLLEQAHAHAKLPVLDNLRIAAPCTADWNQMTGDERTRHCGECKKNVYNLSGMTRDEAEALLIERNGDLCVRYYQRHDGTILLADCTVGLKRRRRRRWIAAGAATLLAGGGGAMAGYRALHESERLGEPVLGQAIMGEPAALPTSSVESPPPSPLPPTAVMGIPERPTHIPVQPKMGRPSRGP